MRWSIIRLIWMRELRDQLRDRRTLFMIAVLPLVLYPLGGLGLMHLALGFLSQSNTVQIVGQQHLPPASPLPAASWFACTPAAIGTPAAGLERVVSAFALSEWRARFEFSPLLDPSSERPRFPRAFLEGSLEADALPVDLPEGAVDQLDQVNRADLDTRRVDVIIFVPPGFTEAIERGKPQITILTREGDERSRLVSNRVSGVLNRWKARLKVTRLLRAGLPVDFDEPFQVRDPDSGKPTNAKASEEITKLLSQIFPFVLVMWSLAGALYPAVDLCAGEKERGTMETLLISPVSREEIVWGKFLTIWVFSAATALLNLFSMGFTTWGFTQLGDLVTFQLSFLLWGALLLLPLSAFFSALCLAVGVYARSSKEGQYYLMPLFLVTMPLVFLTLAPGVELNHFYSMVPVTGVALFLQSLMKTGAEGKHLLYLLPVLAPTILYSWLALRWAIEQFQREEVLFREAERLDIGLWLKRLFREKESLPSTGQAFFCFVLILALHRLALGAFRPELTLVYVVVSYLAFVATPPLFMALLLTRHPFAGLSLTWPALRPIVLAVILAGLLFLPGAELTYHLLHRLPGIRDSLRASQDLLKENLPTEGTASLIVSFAPFLLAIAALQATCEELAFRGFILTGLRKRFRPWMAIFLSSFLFALFQLNVFQFIPHLALGMVMGFLVWRSGSVLPAIVFHFVYNSLVYTGLILVPAVNAETYAHFIDKEGDLTATAVLAGIGAIVTAGALLTWYARTTTILRNDPT